MIIELSIGIAATALLLWLVLMFMWWREEQKKADPLVTETALTLSQKSARLARRGWYALEMKAGKAAHWCNRRASRAFFTLFPSAAPAFAKRNKLAGLSHGPSSFFLMSISQEEKAPRTRRAPARKRIV